VWGKAEAAEMEKEVKEPMDIDDFKLVFRKESTSNTVVKETEKMPRRSTRIIKLNNDKKDIKKIPVNKEEKKSKPKKEAKIENKKEAKRESRRIIKSKIKTIRSKKKTNIKDNNKTSKKKAQNSIKDKSSHDYSSFEEVISTNLDLNESISVKKDKVTSRKILGKKKLKHSQPRKKQTNFKAADMANLTKTFDNFIKFCQNRFDLLENKLSNNRNKSNRGGTTNKKMSVDEKIALKNKIENFNREQIMGLYKIVNKNPSKKASQSEIEINFA